MDSANRFEPPQVAGERATLTGFLQFQRDTLAWKCSGLTPQQLMSAPIAPSTLSLLGLVRHMANVEQGWFREVFAAEDLDPIDDEWAAVDVDATFDLWRATCARSRKIVEAAPSLDDLGLD